MKTKHWARFIASFLVATCAIVPYGTAQNQSREGRGPRYRLIDLGTFGGPASYFQNGLDGILNNRGTAVGWANTADHDPFDPVCIAPNCFVVHAFQFKNGTLRDLGTLPGGTGSQAQWISANGLIAGLSGNGEVDPTVPGFPQIRAVLWLHGQILDLGTLPGGSFENIANAVNNRGQVVGLAVNTTPDSFSFFGLPTQTRAFLWQDGVMQDIGTLGGPDAIGGLINDQAEITGPSYLPIDPATGAPSAVHPFFWKNGKMTDIGSLGGTDSEPKAMNERGEVVGFSTVGGDSATHPFLWRRGKLTDLGTLGGNNGDVNWINDEGDIAGKGDLPGPAPQLHDAVLWRNGRPIDLGVLPGEACSNAYYVNSRGQVVGTSESLDLCLIPTGQHAFLWEKGGPMVDLNTLIPPGADLSLTFAVAINDRGEIAGFGVPPGCAPADIESCGHAYILLPCGRHDDCTNQTVGETRVFAVDPLGPNTARTSSLPPTVGVKNHLQRRLRLPGQRTSPSD